MFVKTLASLVVITLITWLGLLIWCQWPDQLLHIITCDVGQGDGILITQGFTQVVIDAGPDEKMVDCLQKYLPFWDRHLEIMVATHAHQDHIGGMPAIFDRFTIGSLLLTGQSQETDDFRAFREEVWQLYQKGTKILPARQGIGFKMTPEVELSVLWPLSSPEVDKLYKTPLTETQLSAYLVEKNEEIKSINNGSIVILLQFDQFTFLATGDLEAAGEKTLIASQLIADVTILKAGHHGSKTSSSTDFLTEVRPEFTVVSCGQDNTYGHPHPEVLRRLEAIGSHILRTDQLGHLEVQTNGSRYWLFHQLNHSKSVQLF